MIVQTNILATPLLIVAWSIDVYLFLSALRFALSHLRGRRAQEACQWLKPMTDWLPSQVGHRLARRGECSHFTWLPWLVVIVACLVLRHLIIWFVVEVL